MRKTRVQVHFQIKVIIWISVHNADRITCYFLHSEAILYCKIHTYVCLNWFLGWKHLLWSKYLWNKFRYLISKVQYFYTACIVRMIILSDFTPRLSTNAVLFIKFVHGWLLLSFFHDSLECSRCMRRILPEVRPTYIPNGDSVYVLGTVYVFGTLPSTRRLCGPWIDRPYHSYYVYEFEGRLYCGEWYI